MIFPSELLGPAIHCLAAQAAWGAYFYYVDKILAIFLKIISFHNLSLRAPLAVLAANGWPKQDVWETNQGGRQFSKSWREGSIYLYVMCHTRTWNISPLVRFKWQFFEIFMAIKIFSFTIRGFNGKSNLFFGILSSVSGSCFCCRFRSWKTTSQSITNFRSLRFNQSSNTQGILSWGLNVWDFFQINSVIA